MKINSILYPKIYWWLLLLVPLVFFGFYPTYFSVFPGEVPGVMHFHAVFMTLWVAIVIAQPILIKYKKIKQHRLVGRLSYFVIPFVVTSIYLIMYRSYYAVIGQEMERIKSTGATIPSPAPHEIAADYIIITVVYLFWLVVFYALAIINRKKMVAHATYMFAAILTFLGPTIDRIIFQVYQRFGWDFNLFAESFVFGLILLLLGGLYWYQRRRGVSTRPVTVAFLLYLCGEVLYFTLPGTTLWHKFMRWFMLG